MQVKASLIKEGYSFIEKDDEFYVFAKGRYQLSVGLKQNAVSILSVQEPILNQSKVTDGLNKLGFKLTKTSNGSNQITPASMFRYEKAMSIPAF
ncbi:hypothetical protein [Taibaiella sp. KBW10]|uniref:hypothetical protein n=1 Tax=Taibaiella sp. KBW10 TaxID=2153357 RepID=UPI001F465400|nr:hypothetical protein [Taibaiella sp. KBW10]